MKICRRLKNGIFDLSINIPDKTLVSIKYTNVVAKLLNVLYVLLPMKSRLINGVLHHVAWTKLTKFPIHFYSKNFSKILLLAYIFL